MKAPGILPGRSGVHSCITPKHRIQAMGQLEGARPVAEIQVVRNFLPPPRNVAGRLS